MSIEQTQSGEASPATHRHSSANQGSTWLEKAPIAAAPWLTIEVLIFASVILLALFSRFYDLGTRVMSHDESLHTYYSYLFSQGQGYQHNPMMHGPLQFHLIALTYFLFGASDFTARIPAAVFSILTVVAVWQWRRYLGRAGTLVAATMTLISPFLLYYGRYTREDPYVGVSLFVMLYSVLRYFETGKAKFIYLISGALLLHTLTKETSFIYAAMMLIYLAVYLFIRIIRKPWGTTEYRPFIISIVLTALFVGAALIAYRFGDTPAIIPAASDANPAASVPASKSPFLYVFAVAGLVSLGTAGYFVLRGYGLSKIREERSFDLLIVFGTLTLPMLSAFAMQAASIVTEALWKFSVAIPTGENDITVLGTGPIIAMAVILAIFIAIAVWIGYLWNWDVWWKAALIFFAIYTVFYTSFFTNGAGFLTGVIGSLGYWLGQHGVERGSQPWYYYTLITIPIYEFLPALASLFALYLSIRSIKQPENATEEMLEKYQSKINLASLLGWWSFSSILAFTIAGEKMPWLTFHMALPMVLWGGWAIGQLIDSIDWAEMKERKPLLVGALAVLFVIGVCVAIVSGLGNPGPFSGKNLAEQQVTATFLVSILGAVASAWGLYILLKGWSWQQIGSLALLSFFGLMAILTTRASIRANYVLYDSGMEQIVYAHGYTGIKDALRQVSDLSEKTTGDPYAIVVAYDNYFSWPGSWYMREFKNAKYYGDAPGADLREVPAIFVGPQNYSKVEPLVGDKYYKFEYIRMVWPNQDYFSLVTERSNPDDPFPPDYPCTGVVGFLQLIKNYDYSKICKAITDPAMREAVFNIWLNRDYTKYAEVTGSTGTTPENWDPSERTRLYIKKDVAQIIWKYGAAPVPPQPDPYEKGMITLTSDLVVGGPGSEVQFNSPRGMAFGPDGSFYVTDSRNHRIQHFGADGKLINAWGSFADSKVNNDPASAPGGTFNEPWGVAVGPDGSVYVSDTWNGRVQKFDANGKFIKMWGTFGQSDPTNPNLLYGPRGISADKNGHVYVADTGNKRIMVYDAEGNQLAQIGSEGFDVGQFSEPVDVTVDAQGNVYVTDTWNQRVQVFAPSADGLIFTPSLQWPINGWKTQSLDNKPYIAVSPNGHVFVTDPEGYRVIEFTATGEFVQLWGSYGTDNSSFGMTSGIAVDAKGLVWVTDPANNRIMRFAVPTK
jgi:predicted membrane-bound mannosyltransferase/sugar lactone lactonase YvrE